MGRFLVGMVIMIIGVFIIYFSPQILGFVGQIDWAEQKLGGTKNAIVLFGFIIIILGVLFMFGIIQTTSLT